MVLYLVGKRRAIYLKKTRAAIIGQMLIYKSLYYIRKMSKLKDSRYRNYIIIEIIRKYIRLQFGVITDKTHIMPFPVLQLNAFTKTGHFQQGEVRMLRPMIKKIGIY